MRTFGRLFVAVAALSTAVVIGVCLASIAHAQVGVSTGDGGWVWQNPRPTGNSYADVCFRGTLRGWVVGESGTILHTFNGGITWYRQLSGTSADLKSVDFADAGNGWAVGTDGTVLHTTNGGDTWEPQDADADGWLGAVTAVDPLHACVVASNGHEVISTSDGGLSWSVTDVGPVLGGQTIHDISFGDTLQGWIATSDFGMVLRTSDGGVTWRAQDSGAFYVSDSGMAHIAAADGRRACLVLERSSVYTTDGGLTWKKGDSASVGGSGMGSISSIDLCPDGIGWAVSFYGAILRTADAGAHWIKQRDPTPGAGFLAVCCADADHAWVVGHAGAILATRDGGTLWQSQSKGDLIGLMVNYFTGLDFVDALHGWAVCDTVVRTADGGARWTPLDDDALPLEPWEWLNDVDFVDTNQGCAVGEGGHVLRSSDGGLTWRHASTPPTTVALRAVTFADASHGWAVGDGSIILHTSDGGVSWTAQQSGMSSLYLCDVDFIDTQNGWIVGTHPAGVQRTVDGGETWVPQDVGVEDAGPVTVDFIDAEHGWIGCGGGQGGIDSPLLSTSDGGETWTPLYLGLDVGWSDVAFTDQQHGWAVGYFGTVARTVDGGETWTAQPSGTQNWLTALTALDTETAWIAGDLFTILHTFDGGLPIPDVIPPDTGAEGDIDGAWQNEPAELMLMPSDVESSLPELLTTTASTEATGVQLSAWVLDPTAIEPSRFRWLARRTVKVTAQGRHKVVYRSIDNAGNVETVKTVTVRIDTLCPTPKAPYPASVRRGGIATLRFLVRDPRPGSPTCNIKIVVKNASGVILKTFRLADRPVNTELSYSFRCWLRAGVYRFVISARDTAGNPQTQVARNTLTVR